MLFTIANKVKYFWHYISAILREIKREHIGAFAAQSAFFLIMSFIPMIFLVIIVVDFSNLEVGRLRSFVASFFEGIDVNVPRVSSGGVYSGKTALLSMTTLITAWSAGKSFKALTEGFHSVLHVCETRNYILQRLRGLLSSFLFAVTSALLFLTGVFGEKIYTHIAEFYPLHVEFAFFTKSIRKLFIFLFLFIIFSLIYRFVPDWNSFTRFGKKRIRMKYFFVASFMSSLVIFIYTLFFSLYVEKFSTLHNLYGSLTTLICIMLWLYAGMYILILGFKLSLYLNNLNLSKKNRSIS